MNTRYLIAYIAYLPDIAIRYERWISRLQQAGYNIQAICITIDPPGPRLSFPELDKKWHHRDRKLMTLYDKIGELSIESDCLVNLTGANLHPDFVSQLQTFNVFICNDDPESSDDISKPCASAYDYCFTGNIACIELYHSWRIKQVDFLPLGFFEDDYDPTLTEEDILTGNRDHDLAFIGERLIPWRRERLDRVVSAFPQGLYYGRGWPKGYLSMNEMLSLYRNLKIGLNIHNSVGPVNRRTYALPANGVLQICDNRCRLGHLFELSKEVIGVDSVHEMIEAAQYYLSHDEQRRKIAAAGWKRATKDYTEMSVWERLLNNIHEPMEQFLKTGQKTRIGNWVAPSFEKRVRFDVTCLKKRFKGKLKKIFRRFGYDITNKKPFRESKGFFIEKPYIENPEKGPINIELKNKLVKQGSFFEWPDIVALNYAVAALVGSEANKIIEIGGGTGTFAYEASVEPSRHVVSCELNNGAHVWARKHRWRPNIDYITQVPDEDAEHFDLVVSIEVIEHVNDYFEFLRFISNLAHRALLTTPNKLSKYQEGNLVGPPSYEYHVREWTAGEFYWILRGFYQNVTLFAMPNVYVPWCERVNIETKMTPIIADCRNPLRRVFMSRPK